MSGWGCPHELRGRCKRVSMKAVIGEDVDEHGNAMPKCDPGMKGCTLYGRYRFSNDDKNKQKKNGSEKNEAED